MFKKDFCAFKNKVWLSSPTMHGQELTYMKEAYDTNWMSTIGENINFIENSICEKIGKKYAVALTSGTSALHLSVKLAGIEPNDKVFCSDLTFSATVNPIVYEGGIPIFIDTEYDTWNMDPIALKKAFEIYPDVKAVVITHLYGTPAKMDEIKEICRQNNAILIEDAAEALGSLYKGKQAGIFGELGVISFNGNKIITGSSGGMLLTDDVNLAGKARKWSTQSKDAAPWYQHSEIGYNYRMSNVIAGVIRGQIPHLEEHIQKKKEIYERYKKAFENLPLSMNPYDEKNSSPNFWLSCITIDENSMCKQTRDELTAHYEKENGKSCPTEIIETLAKHNVEARPIWKPMHLQPIYKSSDFVKSNDKKDAGSDIFERGLCLPSDIKMTPEEQDKIIEIIKACFE